PFALDVEFLGDGVGGFFDCRLGALDRVSVLAPDVNARHGRRFSVTLLNHARKTWLARCCYDAANPGAAGIPLPRRLGLGAGGDGVQAIIAALLVAASALAGAAEISGHIDLTSEGKELRPEEAQDAVVYFRPKIASKLPPAAAPYVMGTRRKQFVPRVLAVTL